METGKRNQGKRFGTRMTALAVAALSLTVAGNAPAAMCQKNCNQEPPPPPWVPAVSVPDIAFQVTPCPDDDTPIVSSLKSGLTQALKQLDLADNDPAPNPDVRTKCSNGVETIAAWLFPIGYYAAWDNAGTRQLGFDTLKFRKPNESFAIQITKQGMDRLLQTAWQDIDHTFGNDGAPDPDGPLHLANVKTQLLDSTLGNPLLKRIDTRVNGYYEGPFSQVDFYGGVIDFLMLSSDNQIVCTSDPEFWMETTLETIFANVFGLIHDPQAKVAAMITAGPGCRIAEFLPKNTLIGNSAKLTFKYSRLKVSGGSMVAGGTFVFENRNPTVDVTGPTPLKVTVGTPAVGTYKLQLTDMKPPYKVTWTLNGQTYTNTATSTTVSWNLGGAGAYALLSKSITVHVEDVDHFTADTTELFGIKVLSESGLPKQCGKKNYSPECNP